MEEDLVDLNDSCMGMEEDRMLHHYCQRPLFGSSRKSSPSYDQEDTREKFVMQAVTEYLGERLGGSWQDEVATATGEGVVDGHRKEVVGRPS